MITYEQIKRMSKESGRSYKDYIVLAPQNDPFYCGTPADRAQAQWFADLWERFEYGSGTHLRMVHYRLVSLGNVERYDGKPYENTERDWEDLCKAGKKARHLGLVDAAAFVDRRNPNPVIMARYDEPGVFEPSTEYEFDSWHLPTLSGNVSLDEPYFYVSGYDEHPRDQPYHVELWIEKSTMEEFILPVCRKWQVNYIAGVGYQSITGVISLLERAAVSAKPVRIFYVSDFDPSGDNMPVAVSRQIQYWIQDHPEYDIKLASLLLTKEQVMERNLPRTPIKESNLSKKRFEDVYGSGAVELDAMQALYPGDLARIIEEAIIPYRDPDIGERMAEAEREARLAARAERDRIMSEYRNRMEDLKDRAREIVSRYQAFEEEMQPLRQEAAELHEEIAFDMDVYFSPELPERPQSDASEPERDWLYDSRRGYADQLSVFQRRKAGDN